MVQNIVKQLLMPWSLTDGLAKLHVAAVAGEAAASLTAAGLAPPPSIACLLVTSLVQAGCPSQVWNSMLQHHQSSPFTRAGKVPGPACRLVDKGLMAYLLSLHSFIIPP